MSTQANTGGVKNGLLNNLVERGQFRVVKESGKSLHSVIEMVSEHLCVLEGVWVQVSKRAKVLR